jgi:hypothetical protein
MAAAGAGFAEPSVLVSDTIDAYTLVPTKSYNVCTNLPPSSAYGTINGVLDVAQIVCKAAIVYFIDPAIPNHPGEFYLITYSAINSRSM